MQTNFFLRFKVASVGIYIGQRTFELLKPFFVKPMRDQNTCCIFHVELDELRLGLNNMRGQGNVEKVYTHHEHEVCAPCKVLYKGTTSLWESIVCPKSEFDESNLHYNLWEDGQLLEAIVNHYWRFPLLDMDKFIIFYLAKIQTRINMKLQ
jgi:hypothetical protein